MDCCIIVGMSIQEFLLKLKGLIYDTEYQVAVLIVVVAFTSFYLGKASVGEERSGIPHEAQVLTPGEDTRVLTPQREDETEKSTYVSDTFSGYVGSKNGTKYHLPWCGSAKSIKEENKVWFATKEEAAAAGYTPAANCKGI